MARKLWPAALFDHQADDGKAFDLLLAEVGPRNQLFPRQFKRAPPVQRKVLTKGLRAILGARKP